MSDQNQSEGKTLLIIETGHGHVFRGILTRERALSIAQFILAAPEKAPHQQPSGEGTIIADVACGDSQAETLPSSIATQPPDSRDQAEPRDP